MLRSLRWYRYVWSELAAPTLLGLLLWTFLLLMNAFFLVAEKALAKNLGWDLTLRMFSYEVPKLLIMSIPMTVLLATLIAVGRLSADHEWTGLQGAGHGPRRLLEPLLAYGLAWSLLSLLVYGVLVPRANYASRTLQGEVIFLSNLASDLRPGVFYTQLPGTVMFVDNIRPGAEGRLQGVMLHRTAARGGLDELIVARTGDLYPVPDGSGNLAVVLQHGTTHRYSPTGSDTYQVLAFEKHSDVLPAQGFLRGLRDAPSRTIYDMSLTALWGEWRKTARATSQRPELRAVQLRVIEFELHRRLALPLASLLFAFLALPLGVTRARSGKGAGFAVSLAVILIYWIVFTAAQGQATAGRIPAWLGAWAANLALTPWALLGYRRLRRSRGETRGPLAWARDGVVALLQRLARGLGRKAGGTAAIEDNGNGQSPPLVLADLGGTPSRFIGLMDQYIGARFLRLVGLTLLACYSIYTIVEMKRLLEGALQNGQPLASVLRYFAYALPGMSTLAFPIACLVGGIVTFTLLTRTGELTAIKASGINMRRAIVPVLVLTAGICSLLFLVQDRVTPATSRKAEEIKDRLLGRAPVTYGLPAGGKWAFGPQGKRLYHYRLYDPERGVFQGLSVLTLERATPRVLEHRFTPLARWDGEAWTLEGGWYRAFPADGSPWTYEETEGPRPAPLDSPETFTRREAALAARGSSLQEELSLDDLSEQIRQLESSGYDTTRLEVAYWGKLAQPLTPLVMVLLGLPFAFRVGRRGSLYGIGVAILLVIVYWATFAVFNALGLETVLPPLLAAWAPNVLYSLLGAYLILYIGT